MFFIYTPQNASPIYYDPEEAFVEYKRREYVKQVQEQHRRALFDRELQLEKERHEAALAEIARKEATRRQRMAQLEAEARAQATVHHHHHQHRHPFQPQDVAYQQQVGPTPREILARRLARQKEEEQRSRQFHQNILSHIFGVPPEEFDESMEEDDEEEEEEEPGSPVRQPTLAQLVNEFSKRQHLPEQAPPVRKPSLAETTEAAPALTPKATTEAMPGLAPENPAAELETDEPLPESESEPHWSTASERARSLAEISGINRAFNALKSTFVFPSGPLEGLPGSDAPRLAFNSTNATIHAYEHALSDLLPKLDSIESYGFKGVREARKQIVVKIEQELEDLEKKIAERLSEGGAATSVSIPIETPESKEVEMKDIAKEVSSETPALPSEPVETINIPPPVIQPVESTTSSIRPAAEPVEAMTTSTPVIAPVSDAGKLDTSHSTTIETTSDAAKVDNANTSVPSAALLAALPETASDEELEIADAIHIDVTDDESDVPSKTGKEHKSAVGEFEML